MAAPGLLPERNWSEYLRVAARTRQLWPRRAAPPLSTPQQMLLEAYLWTRAPATTRLCYVYTRTATGGIKGGAVPESTHEMTLQPVELQTNGQLRCVHVGDGAQILLTLREVPPHGWKWQIVPPSGGAPAPHDGVDLSRPVCAPHRQVHVRSVAHLRTARRAWPAATPAPIEVTLEIAPA